MIGVSIQGHKEPRFQVQGTISIDFTIMNDQVLDGAEVAYFPESSMIPSYANEGGGRFELPTEYIELTRRSCSRAERDFRSISTSSPMTSRDCSAPGCGRYFLWCAKLLPACCRSREKRGPIYFWNGFRVPGCQGVPAFESARDSGAGPAVACSGPSPANSRLLPTLSGYPTAARERPAMPDLRTTFTSAFLLEGDPCALAHD